MPFWVTEGPPPLESVAAQPLLAPRRGMGFEDCGRLRDRRGQLTRYVPAYSRRKVDAIRDRPLP